MSTIEWEDTSRQNIFDFIFDMAFRDATLRNAFVNPYKSKNKSEGKTDRENKKQAEANFEELKKGIMDKTKNPVAKYLDSILGNEHTVEGVYQCGVYQCKFKCMLDVLNEVKEINTQIKKVDPKHKGFTFGNAQKLVNMSAKYLYIACYANPEMRMRFDECDCPMDSIMIKGVINEAKEVGKDNKFKKLRNNTSWSSLSINDGNYENIEVFINSIPEEYYEFQQWIRKNKYEYENVLDFDFRKWPEWSKKFDKVQKT